MLQLIIDGKPAVLPADMDVSLTLNNFIIEERKEDATYPLTLPLEANRHIFGYPDRINSNNFKTEFPARVICGGYLQLDGYAYVTDVNGADGEIELYISTDNRSFWGVNSAKYIDELNLGFETSPSGMYDRFTASVYGHEEYVCVQMYDFNYNDSQHIAMYYNRWDAARQQLMKSFNKRENTYVPFPRLLSVIRWIVGACGYTVKVNDLANIPGFTDLLLVHRRAVSSYSSRMDYKNIVPHLTVKEFFDEIERKFSVRLFVNEGSKSVFIRSGANIRTASVADLKIFDGIRKTLEDPKDADDKKKNYKFLDKEINDGFVNVYRDQLKFLFGEDNEPETVECISTIAGVRRKTELVYMTWSNPDEGDHEDDITLEYDELAIDWKKETTEFRLTVYRGFKNRAIRGTEENQEAYGGVPVASPIPVADCENPLTLLWTGAEGLFERFHHDRVNFLVNAQQEHELYAVPRHENLANAQQLFSGNIVVNNQRYIIRNQTLKLSGDGITEHTLTVHPV